MLASPQDIFFTTNNNTDSYQNLIHDTTTTMQQNNLKDKRMRQKLVDLDMSTLVDENSILAAAAAAAVAAQNNSLKDKEEQVWPPDVESAFIEALESIPKLGRRKILVNGKPCGRNELISDFIFRKTCKIRTRKQVSSHIQVLKNTRKGDSHFMRLLTDSMDSNDDANRVLLTTATSTTAGLKSKMRQHLHHHPNIKGANNNNMKMKTYQPNDSISSDESSINSSPSPTDYVFDIMYGDPAQQQALSMLQFKDFYDPFQQSILGIVGGGNAGSIATSPFDRTNNSSDTLFNLHQSLDQDSLLRLQAIAAANVAPPAPTSPVTPTVNAMLSTTTTKKKNIRKTNMKKGKSQYEATLVTPPSTTTTTTTTTTSTTLFQSPLIGSESSLWPNYICLYLEYALPYDPCRPLSHNLSQLPHCSPSCLPTISVDAISKEKCPPITSLVQNVAQTVLLFAKTKLDLNLNISDLAFNNTSFFETQTRRTIECTTTIYSFGNVVLESKEVQQALWVNEGKYMYSFAFVNQFFDAFMKGIRSLQSWDEVDIAINNLCIVQSFEDIESKYTTMANASTTAATAAERPTPTNLPEQQHQQNTSSAPLLVMVYEFERGQGTIDISAIVSDEEKDSTTTTTANDITKSLEFFDQDL